MNPVHWIRSRQEERELAYWLSFVAYDSRDRSFNNRLYFVYLVVFFTIWTFVTLALFAGGLATFLKTLSPADPARAAIFLEILLLGLWGVFSLRKACQRSPIVFSEEDATLICQTPVSRRQVTMRWFLMPWFKNAVPFWLIAVGLGFAFAEISLTGIIDATRIPEYTGYGLRSWVALLPVHLALFLIIWIVGVYRLQKSIERGWLAWLAIPIALVVFYALLAVSRMSDPAWDSLRQVLILPFLSGFGKANLVIGLVAGGCAVIGTLAVLYWESETLSLSRAAQETQELDTISTAQRYGFTSYAQELQARRRVGTNRVSSRLPGRPGAAALIWKDIIQSQRAFRLSDVLPWILIFGAMFSLPFLPDLGSRALAVAVWVIQMGKVLAGRVRSDLAHWSLVRQLPIAHGKLVISDLSLAYVLGTSVSLAGLVLGSMILRSPFSPVAVILPGIVAAVAGMAAFDVMRRSRSNLLLNGTVPEVSAGGIILGVLFAFIPLLVSALLPGGMGFLLSIPISWLLGILALTLAVRSYRNIDDA